ncbi:hypothetical protein RAS1_22550 [Phycisphaerae bacterium RAS1]|nr:hypothetical protein RAS1_22550 [Phycisphaerae bacterium RAS1]
MADAEASGFISTLVEGKYEPRQENRLTQILVACFNNDPAVGRAFWKLTGMRGDSRDVRAAAQISRVFTRKSRGILDIELKHNGKTVAVVENKVDAPLRQRQVTLYRKILPRNVPLFALVRNRPTTQPRQVTVLRWADFQAELRRTARSKHTPAAYLAEFLEESGMVTVDHLKSDHLKEVADMLYQLRWTQKPNALIKYPRAFSDLCDMLRDVRNHCAVDKELMKRFGRRVQKEVGGVRMDYWGEAHGNSAYYDVSLSINLGSVNGNWPACGFYVDHAGKWYVEAVLWGPKPDYVRCDTQELVCPKGVWLAKLREHTLRSWKQWTSRKKGA